MAARTKTALDVAKRILGKAGLPLPPIPGRFIESLRPVEPWCFSTRKTSGMAMYFFDRHWKEPLVRRTRPYLAFGHAGHGANSYAVTYELVDRRPALFAQEGFGGIYADMQRDRRGVRAMFERCAALIAAVDDAIAKGLRGPGRLFVVESPMRDLCGWGWLERPFADGQEARAWWAAHRVGPIDYPPGQHRIEPEALPTVAARRWVAGPDPRRPGDSH